MTAVDELVVERLVMLNPGVAVIALHGPLSVHTYEKLEAQLDLVLQQKCSNLILDLTNVRYVSSAGAGVLMNVLSQVRDIGGNLVLVNLTDAVRDILDLLNLQNVLPMAPDVSSALKLFK